MAALLAAALCGCKDDPPAPHGRFLSRLEGAGVDFVHDPGGCGEKYFPEITAAGVSLFDCDGDGDLDLWFAQGEPLPGRKDRGPWLDRLYRNDGGFRFTDVTAAANAGEDGYSYSAACPDVDGDGDLDLWICNLRGDRLLVNDGHGRFTDVTAAAGIRELAWSSCAAFADLDGDGDLDAYVGNYVDYDLEHPHHCGDDETKRRAYCHPDTFAGARDTLWRNDGGRDGAIRFTDVTLEGGLEKATGKALAVVPCDYDLDGDLDLYVANDHVPNFLWRNDGTRGGPIRLVDVAFEVGVAQDGEGRNESCMGSDWADVDGDGDFDLFSSNMVFETNTLWVNDHGFFTDDTDLAGLGRPSYMWVGWGAKFFDQDLDGDLDLAVANGHVIDDVALYDVHQSFAQPAHFYENQGRGKYRLVDSGAGDYFAELHVGRALAAGDLDDDGDVDLVYANWGEPPQLLENTAITGGAGPAWIGLALRGRAPNTQAIGALVECTAGGTRQVTEVRGAGSFQAWNDTRVVFGLGAASAYDRIAIRWPDGSKQELTGLELRRYHVVAQP